MKCIRFLVEPASAVVHKQQRARRSDGNQILAAVVVNIGEQGARRVVENSNARGFGNIFEGPIAAVAVETVGESGWLAYVEVVEPVIIDVSYGNTVVTVDIDTTGAVRTVRQWSTPGSSCDV